MRLEAGDRGEGWEKLGVEATVLNQTHVCVY